MEADGWAEDAANQKLTFPQKIQKCADPTLARPLPLGIVLGLEPETEDALDRWQEFGLFKAAKTYCSTERLGTPMSVTSNRPLAIAPTEHDTLLKALSEEVNPEPDPVARRLAKLQSETPERWGGVRIPPGPGLGLTGSTSQVLRKCASRMSGHDKIVCEAFAARAEEWGV
jgi:hypothetical protein